MGLKGKEVLEYFQGIWNLTPRFRAYERRELVIPRELDEYVGLAIDLAFSHDMAPEHDPTFVRFDVWPEQMAMNIKEISVTSRLRGRMGIGTEIVKRCEHLALEIGAHDRFYVSAVTNPDYWAKLGYECIAPEVDLWKKPSYLIASFP